jgi:putative transposase
MPWNEADRAKHEVIRDRYSTDMSDAEFELISPLLPAPKKRGRKPTGFRVILRVILNAVFDMIRVGCHPGWLSVAAIAEGFSAVHDRSKQILRLAGQRTMAANHRRARDGRA